MKKTKEQVLQELSEDLKIPITHLKIVLGDQISGKLSQEDVINVCINSSCDSIMQSLAMKALTTALKTCKSMKEFYEIMPDNRRLRSFVFKKWDGLALQRARRVKKNGKNAYKYFMAIYMEAPPEGEAQIFIIRTLYELTKN